MFCEKGLSPSVRRGPLFVCPIRRGIKFKLPGREGEVGQIATDDGLFDAGSSPVGSGKSQDELHLARFEQLDGHARFGGRRFEQIGLLEPFHLASRFFHILGALLPRGGQEEVFGALPVVIGFEGNNQRVQAVLELGVFLDQGV